MHLIISSSLRPNSKSKTMAEYIYNTISNKGLDTKFMDLQTMDLPQCDGETCYDHAKVIEMTRLVEKARCILIASPIYNYDLNSAIKNVLELSGSAWKEKIVGLCCAAGGKHSYMAPMSFLNSLMLDYRCTVIPRYVYLTKDDIATKRQLNDDIISRLNDLIDDSIRFSTGLG